MSKTDAPTASGSIIDNQRRRHDFDGFPVTGFFTRAPILSAALLSLFLILELSLNKKPVILPILPQVGFVKPQHAMPMRKNQFRSWATRSILPRPLFVSGRRPPEIVLTSTPAHKMPRLSGIIIAPGMRYAIFAPPDGGKPLTVTEGAAVANTYVLSIKNFQVLLANGTVLQPSFDPNPDHQSKQVIPLFPAQKPISMSRAMQPPLLQPFSIRRVDAQ
jgi:hypothetical protein